MFATDQNIETIGQLVDVIKHYIGLQNEYMRLDVIDKVVRLITSLLIAAVAFVIIITILTYLSFAAAYAIAPAVGTPWAFVIVAAFHFVLFLAFLAFRKSWVEKPLVKFLASLLMEDSTSDDNNDLTTTAV